MIDFAGYVYGQKEDIFNFKLQSNPCVYNACMADKIEMIESTKWGQALQVL